MLNRVNRQRAKLGLRYWRVRKKNRQRKKNQREIELNKEILKFLKLIYDREKEIERNRQK